MADRETIGIGNSILADDPHLPFTFHRADIDVVTQFIGRNEQRRAVENRAADDGELQTGVCAEITA